MVDAASSADPADPAAMAARIWSYSQGVCSWNVAGHVDGVPAALPCPLAKRPRDALRDAVVRQCHHGLVEGDVGRLDARDAVEGRPHLLKGVPRKRLSRFPLNFGGGPHDRQAAIMGSS